MGDTMKKILFILTLFFTFTINTYAKKLEVTLDKCVDGDTAWFNLDNERIKTRFLAINTPESTNKIEAYGKEASNYTCNMLTNAKKIEIEYDNNSDKFDKYDRHLVWVFVDDTLLQEKLLEEGLAEIKYIYGDYKYLDEIKKVESTAKKNKVGMWSDSKDDYSIYLIIIGAIIIILVFIFSKKGRKKILRELKKETKKKLLSK